MKAHYSVPNSAWIVLNDATGELMQFNHRRFWSKKNELNADLSAHKLKLNKHNQVILEEEP